jgi:Ser/Thr protein kinase RdoA (MazF antagonist)
LKADCTAVLAGIPHATMPLTVAWELPAAGTGVAHDLSDPARARERMLLPHLTGWLPVPQLLGTLQMADREYAVYSRVGDADLQDVLPHDAGAPPVPAVSAARPREVSRNALSEVLAQLGEALAALHSAPAPRLESTDGWSFRLLAAASPADVDAYTRSELHRAMRKVADSGYLTDQHVAAADQALAACRDLSPSSLGLVHFDLHPRNVRIAAAGGRLALAGLIDFKNAHYWFPEFDLVTIGWHLAGVPAAAIALRAAYARQRQADPALMRLCELIRLAFVLANAPQRDSAWVAWCARRWDRLAGVPASRPSRGGEPAS